MKRDTRAWVRKAEADRQGAERLVPAKPPLHDLVCFHWQQCVEKYLKSLLAEQGDPIPKTHDLDRLLTLLLPNNPSLKSLRRGLLLLSAFAVETRYPGENATKRQADAAARIGRRTCGSVRVILRLDPK
jgi:HEPN domain-containing protein